jgi:hypothetical protein
MTELSPVPSSSSAQRKIIVIAASGALIFVMLVAFLMGGGKEPPVKKSKPSEESVRIADPATNLNLDQSVPSDEWMNIPEGSVQVAANNDLGSSTPESESSVVRGDGTVPTPQPSPAPLIAAGNNADKKATGEPTTPLPSSENRLPPPTSNSPNANTPPVQPTMAASDTKPLHQKPEPAFAAKTDAEKKIPVTPEKTNPPQSSAPIPNVSLVQSDQKKPEATSTPKTSSVTSRTSEKMTSIKIDQPKNTVKQLAFVRPSSPRPGLIAQTARLVDSSEIDEDVPNSPAVSRKKQTTEQPAKVSHAEAKAFAGKTTEKMRAKGELKPTQQARLPLLSEAPNPKIWREDDAPLSAEERRPFGLVISDESQRETTEGIPLRTDIPAGTSPLEKTGADKPLWKRPE